MFLKNTSKLFWAEPSETLKPVKATVTAVNALSWKRFAQLSFFYNNCPKHESLCKLLRQKQNKMCPLTVKWTLVISYLVFNNSIKQHLSVTMQLRLNKPYILIQQKLTTTPIKFTPRVVSLAKHYHLQNIAKHLYSTSALSQCVVHKKHTITYQTHPFESKKGVWLQWLIQDWLKEKKVFKQLYLCLY